MSEALSPPKPPVVYDKILLLYSAGRDVLGYRVSTQAALSALKVLMSGTVTLDGQQPEREIKHFVVEHIRGIMVVKVDAVQFADVVDASSVDGAAGTSIQPKIHPTPNTIQ